MLLCLTGVAREPARKAKPIPPQHAKALATILVAVCLPTVGCAPQGQALSQLAPWV